MSCSTPRPIPTATAQNRFGAQRLMAAGTYWGQAIERAHRTSVERDTTTPDHRTGRTQADNGVSAAIHGIPNRHGRPW